MKISRSSGARPQQGWGRHMMARESKLLGSSKASSTLMSRPNKPLTNHTSDFAKPSWPTKAKCLLAIIVAAP